MRTIYVRFGTVLLAIAMLSSMVPLVTARRIRENAAIQTIAWTLSQCGYKPLEMEWVYNGTGRLVFGVGDWEPINETVYLYYNLTTLTYHESFVLFLTNLNQTLEGSGGGIITAVWVNATSRYDYYFNGQCSLDGGSVLCPPNGRLARYDDAFGGLTAGEASDPTSQLNYLWNNLVLSY